MNREDIIRMAQEAHGPITAQWWDMDVASLERFATLVAKHTLARIDPSKFMSHQESYEAGASAGRRKAQEEIDTLYEMYKLVCSQRDELMDQQRAQIAAMRGRIQ